MGNVTVEIPEPEENDGNDDARDSLAFAELSEVHSDRAEEHCTEAEEAAEEAEEASTEAEEAAAIAVVAAAEAQTQAEETAVSNASLMMRLDALPGEIAAAISLAMNPPAVEEIDEESGEVVPILPDEAPQTRKRWHHNLIGGSGGIYRGK